MAEFFEWYYHDIPRFIIRAGRGYIRRAWYGLSVPTLVRTLFAPWKRDYEDASDLNLVGQLRAWVETLMSRLVGALIRLGTLFAAVVIVVFELLFYAAAFLLWVALPFIIVILCALGIQQIGAR